MPQRYPDPDRGPFGHCWTVFYCSFRNSWDAGQRALCNYPREVRSLERKADRASKRKDKLSAKIDRTRAYTFTGLAIKAEFAAIKGEEDTQFADTTLESILRDIRKLCPAALS
jgi:hypothetical protein